MAMALYMDVHVPAAITEGLQRRGIAVITSQADGTRTATDEDLLDRATVLKHVLVSQDEDLLQIAKTRQTSGRHFGGLVFAPQEGSSIGRLIEDLQLVAECISADEIANQVIFLPLK